MLGLKGHLVALVASALLPAIAVGAASVWVAMDGYRAAFKARLHDTTAALALAIDAEIDTLRAAVATLAGSAALDAAEPDLDTFRREAERAAATLGTTVALIDPGSLRQVINTSVAPGAEAGRSARQEFRAAAETRRSMVTNLALGHVAGRPVASVAAPVEREGAVRYVLVARLEPARLGEVLAIQTRASGAFATLIDGNNVIVARSYDHDRFVGQKLLDWAVEASQGQDAGLLRGKNRLGEESISGFRRLSGAPGWMIVFGYPIASYNDALRRPVAALALGGALAMAVALLVAAAIGRRILRPLRALTRQAETVAATGDDAALDDADAIRVAEFRRLWTAIFRAEQKLRERTAEVTAGEARLRAVVDTAADAIVVIDESGIIQSFNHAATSIFGHAADDAIGQNISLIMREAEAARHDGHLSAFRQTGVARIMGIGREVTGLRKDGSVVPIDLAIAEWRDSGGTRFFTGIMRDISVRKADEQRKLMLMREVDHRAKNALAVVQSVVHLTSADEPRAFAASVQARVAALARAHSLLAEGGWAGADLRALVERELAPLMSSARRAGTASVRLDGLSVALASTVVQPLAMVLHELAANATKHGSLTSPGGRVEVSWRIGHRSGGDGVLHLRWAEHDGPTVADGPRQRGLGMRMAEATVRGQLGGTIMWRWEPSGLICEMGLPLVRVLSGAQDDGRGPSRR